MNPAASGIQVDWAEKELFGTDAKQGINIKSLAWERAWERMWLAVAEKELFGNDAKQKVNINTLAWERPWE